VNKEFKHLEALIIALMKEERIPEASQDEKNHKDNYRSVQPELLSHQMGQNKNPK